MKKIGLFFALFASLFLFGCSQSTPTQDTATTQVSNINNNQEIQGEIDTRKIDNAVSRAQVSNMNNNQVSSQYQSKVQPDKIEIIEFHSTQTCRTCLTAEALLKKTIETKFSEEAKNGIITFKDVNMDLPENTEITNKFRANGLSIAINTIISGKDNIEYDMNGWRLVSNDEQYIQYFEGKINALLGK